MALRCESGRVFVLDQTCLPHEERWIESSSPQDMIGLIQRLAIRGAPLIGVAAAVSLANFASASTSVAKVAASYDDFVAAAKALRAARPTAVNLMAAIDRVLFATTGQDWRERAVEVAEAIFLEDVALCEAMSERGASIIDDGDTILTHCNSGGLATAGIGTALGAIRRAHEQGKKIHVIVDETRPLLQGARLTAWELGQLGIPYTLICDNMAAALMNRKRINKVYVGADRIAKNGDFANKIGTYSLAVLAKHHQIPFYVVAPRTTFDAASADGAAIVVEVRDAAEVRAGRAPKDAPVWNPAFDVTPRSLISGIIFDDRIL